MYDQWIVASSLHIIQTSLACVDDGRFIAQVTATSLALGVLTEEDIFCPTVNYKRDYNLL